MSVRCYLNHLLNPGFMSDVAIQALIAFDKVNNLQSEWVNWVLWKQSI